MSNLINKQDFVTFEKKGRRDVYWCPYGNEPVFLAEGNECSACNGNFEPETHPFICHILKPYGDKAIYSEE